MTLDGKASIELQEAQDKDHDVLALRAELWKEKADPLKIIPRHQASVDASTRLLTVDGPRIGLPTSMQRSVL